MTTTQGKLPNIGREPDDTPRPDTSTPCGVPVSSGQPGWVFRHGVAHLHVPAESGSTACGVQAGIVALDALAHWSLPGPNPCPICEAVNIRTGAVKP
jgi:hypothetical protein